MPKLTSKQKIALAEMMVDQPTLFDEEAFIVTYIVDLTPKGVPDWESVQLIDYSAMIAAKVTGINTQTARETLVDFLKAVDADPRTILVTWELINAAAFSAGQEQ